jgi:hypothetical protein
VSCGRTAIVVVRSSSSHQTPPSRSGQMHRPRRSKGVAVGPSGCGRFVGGCRGLSTTLTGLLGMRPRTTARRRMPCSNITALRCVCTPTFAEGGVAQRHSRAHRLDHQPDIAARIRGPASRGSDECHWDDLGERILHAHAGKTERDRVVDVLAPLAQDLAEWRLAQGRPAGKALIFPRQGGKEWQLHDWQNWRRRIYQPAAKAAGVTGDMRPYRLRGRSCRCCCGRDAH